MTLIDQIATARVFDLEQPRFAGMPLHPAHKPGYFYALHRRHKDSYRPDKFGPRTGSSGVLTMMEHSGTHIDALCHQACDMTLYKGVKVEDVERVDGFREYGAETMKPLLGRGVLLDVAGWKKVDSLPPNHSISADELAACAKAQRVEVRAGDVLLVRTGYARHWNDEATYLTAAAYRSPRTSGRRTRKSARWARTTWRGTRWRIAIPRRTWRCSAMSICSSPTASTSSRT